MLGKLILLPLIWVSVTWGNPLCQGHIINPITEVCWRCLFPLSLGGSGGLSGLAGLPDTPNPSAPIGHCGMRLGFNIGYWEPAAMVEVTATPYCLPNLGGMVLPLGGKRHQGGALKTAPAYTQSLYQVHWYRYPLMSWLNQLPGCRTPGGWDVLWLSELDPTWANPMMARVLYPEVALFANPKAQMACGVEAAALAAGRLPQDNLFWCAGAQGTLWPLVGLLDVPLSPGQAAMLLAERMNALLHRKGLSADSAMAGKQAACHPKYHTLLPKSRYRYQWVNPVADGNHCYPSGYPVALTETGKRGPQHGEHFGFLVWQKRHCVFL